MYSELYEETEKILKQEVYKNIEVSLTKNQKEIFDIICTDNKAEVEQPEIIMDYNMISIDDIDISNIDWDCVQEDYWEKLICKLYNNDSDVSHIISHLKENYYPNVHGLYHKNWNSLLYAGLENRKSHKLFYDLLVKISGYCGFYCLIQAYKNDIENSIPLYKRYHQFCQLLTRRG